VARSNIMFRDEAIAIIEAVAAALLTNKDEVYRRAVLHFYQAVVHALGGVPRDEPGKV